MFAIFNNTEDADKKNEKPVCKVLQRALHVDDLDLAEHGRFGGPDGFRGGGKGATRDRQQEKRE